MGLFDRYKNFKYEIVSKEEAINLTQNVNVANVKQYLLDEYDRAFERENKIEQLKKELEEKNKIELEYNAMCIASEKQEKDF